MDGAAGVFLLEVNREGQRHVHVGSSIWSWSRVAMRATEAGGRCLDTAHRRWVGPRVFLPCGYVQVGEYK